MALLYSDAGTDVQRLAKHQATSCSDWFHAGWALRCDACRGHVSLTIGTLKDLKSAIHPHCLRECASTSRTSVQQESQLFRSTHRAFAVTLDNNCTHRTWNVRPAPSTKVGRHRMAPSSLRRSSHFPHCAGAFSLRVIGGWVYLLCSYTEFSLPPTRATRSVPLFPPFYNFS